MKELINSIKDFKIIPNNFKSSGVFNLISSNEDSIEAELVLIDDNELNDYIPGTNVEIFGVNEVGLVYFETKIIDRIDKKITLKLTDDFSIIQRREYSRVGLNQGSFIFKDRPQDFVLKTEDISAGGIKFIAKENLELDKNYDIEITLSNNMKINCTLQPIRIQETEYNDKKAFIMSGKFTNLDNVDRIVLVQYAFKIKMEEQNKENE